MEGLGGEMESIGEGDEEMGGMVAMEEEINMEGLSLMGIDLGGIGIMRRSPDQGLMIRPRP